MYPNEKIYLAGVIILKIAINSVKTLNVVNTFKIKFKVHLNIEKTEVGRSPKYCIIVCRSAEKKPKLITYRVAQPYQHRLPFIYCRYSIALPKDVDVNLRERLERFCPP